MIFRSLSVLLCLAAPLLAQDAPKPAEKQPAAPPAEKPAATAAAGWQWQTPSYTVLARFSKLSEAAKARLEAEFASNSEALQALSVKEYNARFEKAFRADVEEDEAKGLSSGGVPAEMFMARTLTSTVGSPRSASRTGAGPSPEQRERWEKLSEAAKERVKNLFRDNRERVMKMTDEERRAFFESNFQTIEEADKASPTGK